MRQVGSSGLAVSLLGVGCNNFGRRLDAAGAARVVHAATDSGITLFDTADIYGGGASEEILGAAVRDRRDRVVIATKFGGAMGEDWSKRGASRRWIRHAVEDSLKRLGTDHIDLYQLHFPDPATPIDETLETLDALVSAGTVRYIGSSNFAGWEIADAAWTARHRSLTPFISAQNEYSLLERGVEQEVLPACRRFRIGLIPYFPLASGVLTGKYARGKQPGPETRLGRIGDRSRLTERNLSIVDRLREFTTSRGVGLLDVAIGWLAANPLVSSVIAGAMSPEQIAINVAASEWQPSAEDLDQIDTITTPATN